MTKAPRNPHGETLESYVNDARSLFARGLNANDAIGLAGLAVDSTPDLSPNAYTTWLPLPDEIADSMKRIRDNWTDAERLKRAAGLTL